MAKRTRKKAVQPARPARPAPTATRRAAAAPKPVWWRREWVLGLVLVLAVIAVYVPVWWAGYIWDDDVVVTDNSVIIGPQGVWEIWTTKAADICPMTLTVFWVEHAIWGIWALPYHLVNVALQSGCALLLWRVLRRMEIPGAWLGAALWALHPVQVESVAWITEMKNTLSGLFYLLSLLSFGRLLQAEKNGRKDGWAYGWMLFYAALAMASKSTTVILPAVLCLAAWWREGRWRWGNLVRIAPVFVLSLLASIASILTQHAQGFHDVKKIPGLAERLAAGGDAVWFYLLKLAWPYPLITVYRHWEIDPENVFCYAGLLGAVVLLGVLWWKRETWARPYFFVYAYFLAALLPALGLVNMVFFRYSFVADHFQYLASMAPLALAGAGLARLPDLIPAARTWLPATASALLLLVLAAVAFRQAGFYYNAPTLWSNTLAWNSTCWVGYNNYGNSFFQKGRIDEAVELYEKALDLNPEYAEGYNNLGAALFKKDELDPAMADYQKALQLDPGYPDVYNNIGNILAQRGHISEAMADYERALALRPAYADAHNNRGNILMQLGRADEAVAEYKKALQINPDDAQSYNNLGIIAFKTGHAEQAVRLYERALQIDPTNVESYNNLGVIFFQAGQTDKAVALEEEALRRKPTYGDARKNLGKMEEMIAKGTAPK
jgi:tetratricopeptide (TPR) repeat protein